MFNVNIYQYLFIVSRPYHVMSSKPDALGGHFNLSENFIVTVTTASLFRKCQYWIHFLCCFRSNCTLHRHCHYQKYKCQIYLLRCLRISRHPILYYLATFILQKHRSGHFACGGGGDGDGGGGVSSLHTRIASSLTFFLQVL